MNNIASDTHELMDCDQNLEQAEQNQSNTTAAFHAYDVLCGRDKISFNHVGNRRFRDAVTASILKYNNANLRFEKSMIVNFLIQDIRSKGGKFLKLDKATGKWVELDDRKRIEKVGHAIRDAVAFNRSPGKKCNKKKHVSTAPSKTRDAAAADDCVSREEMHSIPSVEDLNKIRPARRASLSSVGSDSICVTRFNDSSSTFGSSSKFNDSCSSLGSSAGEDDEDDFFVSQINEILGPLNLEDKVKDLLAGFVFASKK